MKFFKKKKNTSRLKQLEDALVEELKKPEFPINQHDRLKCIYYKEFQKQEMSLYNSNPLEFWRRASKYAENKLRKYMYKKEEKY